MGESATTTNQSNLLKRLYGTKTADQVYKASRIISRCKKDTKFTGEDRTVHITVAPVAGGSATFVKAMQNQQATKEVRFVVYRRKEYVVFSLQGELIEASKNDAGAIVRQLKHQTDKAQKLFANRLSARVWGPGGGAIGVIAAGGITDATVTLENQGDVVKFFKGQKVTFADDNGTAATPAGLRSSGATLEVLSTNPALGTVTFTANVSTLADVVVGDFMFTDGDYAMAITGLPGWVPSDDPSSDAFFGVDRTTQGNMTKVSGVRWDGENGQMEETLIDACAFAEVNDVEDLNTCYVHPFQYRDLLHELGAKRERDSSSDGEMSYRTLSVYAPWGEISVVADKYVPEGKFWVTRDEDICLASAGECPSLLNHSGVANGGLLPAYDADAVQGRLGTYANTVHENPGNTIAGTW